MPTFAHNSEREFARLLDFYGIRWEYEPHTFDIAWDAKDEPCKFFAPDFYLPDEDRYIELTTMGRKLKTPKNRKIRLMRRAHPDIRVDLFDRRDYLHLALRFGLEMPEQIEGSEYPTRIPMPGGKPVVYVLEGPAPNAAALDRRKQRGT